MNRHKIEMDIQPPLTLPSPLQTRRAVALAQREGRVACSAVGVQDLSFTGATRFEKASTLCMNQANLNTLVSNLCPLVGELF